MGYKNNPFDRVKRLRKNTTKRMLDMLEMIKSKKKVHWTEIEGYRDSNTINALMNRLYVKRDQTDEYYVPCEFTDEMVESHWKAYEPHVDR